LTYGDERSLVYSPRFGRTYLLPPALTIGSVLPRLLGLRTDAYREQLDDPASSVLTFGTVTDEVAPRHLRLMYIFFHRHRTLASVGRVIRLASWVSGLRKRRLELAPSDIGRLVAAVEHAVGVSDCYPRALVTAYLCISARLSCEVSIGILAPTAKMHAWCSSRGSVLYEPKAQHWWFCPLAVFDVS
jgi:hypothetical protein